MDVCIITGASKGLGQALSKRLHESGYCVYGLARSKGGMHGMHVECDLSNPMQVQSAMGNILEMIDLNAIQSICLFNNAADLNPIVPVGKSTADEIDRSLRINLTAPAILSSMFIRQTRTFGGGKRIINIISKTAEKPFSGLSLYCMAKAGVEQLTRCVALEQEGAENPVIIVSVDPGTMDTGMQETIRATSVDHFPYSEHFRKRYENNGLPNPETVADFVVEVAGRDDLINGGRYAFLDRHKL